MYDDEAQMFQAIIQHLALSGSLTINESLDELYQSICEAQSILITEN